MSESNANAVALELERTFDLLDKDLLKLGKDTAQHIFDKTEQGADEHAVTGAMRNAVSLLGSGHEFEIGVDTQAAPHAMFVHFGTKAHIIKRKKKKTLRWSSGGGFAFTTEVHHPGYKGDPFFYKAIDSGFIFLDKQAQQLKLK